MIFKNKNKTIKNLKSKKLFKHLSNKFLWVSFSLIIFATLFYTLIADAQQGDGTYIPPLGCDFDRPDFKFGESSFPVSDNGVFKTPINYNIPSGFRSKLCEILKPVIPPDNNKWLGKYGGKVYNGWPLFKDTLAEYRKNEDINKLMNLCTVVKRIPKLTSDETEIDYLYEIGYNPALKGFWIDNTPEIEGNETYGQNNYIAWVNFFSKRYWLEDPDKDRIEKDELMILPMEYDLALSIKKREKLEDIQNPTQRDQKRDELNFEIQKLRNEVEIYPEATLDLNVEAFINEIKEYECNQNTIYRTLQRWSAYDKILADWTKKMYADDLINTVRRSSDILK